MRILFFHLTPAPTGGSANQYVFDILPRIREAGHAIALVHARDTPSQFRGTGYIYDELKEPRPVDKKAAARLRAIVEDFAPDLIQFHHVPNYFLDGMLQHEFPLVRFVHTHTPYCSGQTMTWRLPLRACAKAHGRACLVRHVFRGCGALNPMENWMRYQGVSQFLGALRKCAAVQTLTQSVQENLVRNGVPEERIQLLPTPVPPPLGKAPERGTSKRRVVLHVGGLISRKGIWVAIRTLRALPSDCDLVFAGGGPDHAVIERHIKSRGLGDRVRVFAQPSLEEWGTLYGQADLVILPCLWNEPLGLPAIRAMAYGKPVVAYRTGGLPDWLVDGENGVLVPLEKRNEFQNAVAHLLNHPEELARLGKQAQKMWAENHRMEAHLAALLEGYEKVRASHPGTVEERKA
jgi:glycosyltransferase involved in cell wall biosynthesis